MPYIVQGWEIGRSGRVTTVGLTSWFTPRGRGGGRKQVSNSSGASSAQALQCGLWDG